MDVLADGEWERVFTEKPEVFTKEEKRAWLDKNTDVALGTGRGHLFVPEEILTKIKEYKNNI